MSTQSTTPMLALYLSLVICLVELTSPSLSLEPQDLCEKRSGLKSSDFGEKSTRNEGCAVDCITKQGTVMTTFVSDGTSCHDSDGYKCVFGRCRSPDDRQYEENEMGLNEVEIKIDSAFVADRDPYPAQGESDTFVVVELASGGEPAYKDGDILCHTPVIQDNSNPRWNFSCKPLPMKDSAKLRFVAHDSDKPDTSPQLLGASTQTLESLMNQGSKKLNFKQPDLPGGPYWLEVEVTGRKCAFNE